MKHAFTTVAVIVAWISISNCGPAGTSATSTQPNPPVELAAGTPVSLILVSKLEAGEADKGDLVALMAAEDVVVNGATLIRKGASALGTVEWSRSEGTLSGILNQPARLDIRLAKTFAVDGQEVPLVADHEHPNELYRFDRANTNRPAHDKTVGEILEDPTNRELAERLSSALVNGNAQAELEKPEVKLMLLKLANEAGYVELQKALDNGSGNATELGKILDSVKSNPLGALTNGQSQAMLAAATQLIQVAGDLGGSLTKKLKGRTIKALPGTMVRAYVAESTTIKP